MERAGFGIRVSGFVALFGLGFSVIGSLAAVEDFPRSSPEPNPRITIRAYDQAKIGSQRIHGAIKEASAILRKARIESVWIICAESNDGFPVACQQSLAANELALRIVRRAKPSKGSLGCTQCGAAIEDERGRGTYATVYADCLDTRPQVDGLLPSLMLGHLIAHEIGHLLLPGRDHEASGIMCAQMRDREWALAVTGQLVFGSAQAATLRSEVRERVMGNTAANTPEIAMSR